MSMWIRIGSDDDLSFFQSDKVVSVEADGPNNTKVTFINGDENTYNCKCIDLYNYITGKTIKKG